MFAIAARYADNEIPPPPDGKMWEAGCEFLDDAREILSMQSFLSISRIYNITVLHSQSLPSEYGFYLPIPPPSWTQGIWNR
jgi:hypothetical protein